MIAKYFALGLIIFSKSLWKMASVLSGCARRVDPDRMQKRSVISSTRYDMLRASDEPYYAAQYWTVIQQYLSTIPENAKILDLGCGQGRFSLRLASMFSRGEIIACDVSSLAITQAISYAGEFGVANISFLEQDIAECLGGLEINSVDVIFMTEVAFFYPAWEDLLPKVVQVLKPGGVFILSSRSQYFNGLCLLRDGKFSMLDLLLNHREGGIFGPSTTFTWQTSKEVKALLEDYSLNILEQIGIGVCSGIPGDPHDSICRPSLLSDREKSELMRTELELGASVPDAGRYILTIAKKPVAT